MSEIHQPTMELDNATFECPTCGCEIAAANQLTHEVACARMQRNNQRAPAAQPIVRQSSSSALPDQQPRAQQLPRREDRRVVENKLVTCPNCEKSVREQDINSHMDNECLKNEMIPCEFCDESIPMDNYSQHVESCPRRSQNQPNVNRDRDSSPIRERPSENIPMQEESDDFEIPQEESPSERDRSPQRGSSQEESQGGIRGFFRTIANTASNAYRTYTEEVQRQQEERERHREEEGRRQQEMLRHMFGQPQVQRNPFSNESALVPYRRPNGGSRVVRTVERGPGGSIIVRSRVVPAQEPQMFQGMPEHPMMINRGGMQGMQGMDPMAMLFNMMSGNMGGMHAIENGGQMAPEQTGLNKQTIDSLALTKYSKEANKNVDEELKKCSICLDEFEEGQDVRFLWCTHRFHKNCVDHWLESHTNCPLCKKDFSEAEQDFSP